MICILSLEPCGFGVTYLFLLETLRPTEPSRYTRYGWEGGGGL